MLSSSQISILLGISALGSITTSFLFGFSVIFLDTRQKLAYQGDTNAAKKLILPCYRPLYVGLTLFFILLSFAQLLTLAKKNLTNLELLFVLQLHSLCLLAAFLICPLLLVQHSVSKRGFILTASILLPWFLLSLVFLILIYVHESWFLVPQIIFLFLTFLPTFLLSVGILSRTIVSRIRLGSRSNRNTVEHLLVFVIIFALLNLLDIIGPTNSTLLFSLLITYVVVTLVWSVLFVLSTHRSLLADTKFWRGLGTHNQGGILAAPQVNDLPHPNIQPEVASTYLQDMMSNIGSLVIDFAFLEAKERIGDGSTSIVYSGQYKGQSVAIKMSTPDEITEEVLDEFIKEGKLSSSLDHKNIVKFIGLCVRPPQIAFVTEFCHEGNLKSSISKNPGQWTHKRRLRACLDACRALDYLHNKNYIHRDLKTENFFVMKDLTIKLGDFGETTPKRTRASQAGRKMSIVGTVSYMAPELIANAPFYTSAIDVYALGITFWEIWTGQNSYADKSTFEIYKLVEDGTRPEVSDCIDASPELLRAMTLFENGVGPEEENFSFDGLNSSDQRKKSNFLSGTIQSFLNLVPRLTPNSSAEKESGDVDMTRFDTETVSDA
jgi:tRNA A-37 threonylcarbamoyl transferase component Bud32